MSHPLQMFYRNISQFGKKGLILLIRSSLVEVTSVNILSMGDVTAYGHAKGCHVT